MGTEGLETIKQKVLTHQMSYSMPIEEYRKVLQILDSRMLSDSAKTQQLINLMWNNVTKVVNSVQSKLDIIFLGALSNKGVFLSLIHIFMKLLLISNSTNAGEPYLKYPMPRIDEFLGSVREVVFVPYAGITFSYAEYEAKVQARFAEYGIKVRSVHRSKDPRRMIREAQAICVGGGNTFALTKKMQEQGLLKACLLYTSWTAAAGQKAV